MKKTLFICIYESRHHGWLVEFVGKHKAKKICKDVDNHDTWVCAVNFNKSPSPPSSFEGDTITIPNPKERGWCVTEIHSFDYDDDEQHENYIIASII